MDEGCDLGRHLLGRVALGLDECGIHLGEDPILLLPSLGLDPDEELCCIRQTSQFTQDHTLAQPPSLVGVRPGLGVRGGCCREGSDVCANAQDLLDHAQLLVFVGRGVHVVQGGAGVPQQVQCLGGVHGSQLLPAGLPVDLTQQRLWDLGSGSRRRGRGARSGCGRGRSGKEGEESHPHAFHLSLQGLCIVRPSQVCHV